MRTEMAYTESALLLFFACFLLIRGHSAAVICEKLPTNVCTFAVSSAGKRCVLENYSADDGSVGYICKTSEITVERVYGHIETNQCVKACGVDRGFVGISSDPFLSPEFAFRICSNACYRNCPNLVDLYINLAAGEGISLPGFCEKLRSSGWTTMSILSNGGGGAAAPEGSPVPAPSPALY
ncbi:uncharacterized protein LOC127251386 [Andrographis paniculata]|uniref:uncharacterized protein LOC127251386 n=1 Tax=Andrographis paniculata TaxID=175694 RepID=UPI0021E82659|nr:uncharacterized protein LOC127251386 [Andrographis paniculata]